jgi:hypothetical protein
VVGDKSIVREKRKEKEKEKKKRKIKTGKWSSKCSTL